MTAVVSVHVGVKCARNGGVRGKLPGGRRRASQGAAETAAVGVPGSVDPRSVDAIVILNAVDQISGKCFVVDIMVICWALPSQLDISIWSAINN